MSVCAVIVGYDGSPAQMRGAVESLREQSVAPRQVVVVDQTPDDRYASLAGGVVEVISTAGSNLGYTEACELGAQRARADALLFLNPDARAEPDCVQRLTEALAPGVAIVGAQILLGDHARVNAGDNRLHLSGLSWAGRYGEPVEDGEPREVAVASGAALLVDRRAWRELGGYTDGFFMYYDDVDLAWRARLAGWRVMFCPRARVVHDYEFAKGSLKWRWLERNRWWCLLAHLRGPTLLALAPLLLAVETAVWSAALREGWAAAKRDAWLALWRDRRALLARRREVQRTRVCGDRAIVQRMRAEVDSPFLAGRMTRAAAPALRLYRRLLLAILR